MEPATKGYTNAVYFVNWGIYGRNYQPAQLPTKLLTQIIYAFLNVRPDGTVFLSDTYADLEKHYETDSWNDIGTNVYGCIKQLYLLKKVNRHLKTLLSIGGWTYSSNFAVPASTAAGRERFASSTIQLIQDLGFDGVDIDWEYPANKQQGNDFVALLAEVRSQLDVYAARTKSSPMLLTVAMPASPAKIDFFDLPGMNRYVDQFNLMAYDYAGSWDTTSGHQANLRPSISNPLATKFSTIAAISSYLASGFRANKIVMGMPLYGRDFHNTKSIGQACSGTGTGSWEAGVWDFKVLPQPGAIEVLDDEAGANYSWDEKNEIIVSYDNLRAANSKTLYISQNGLAGAMYWEASGDRLLGQGSLMEAVHTGLVADHAMDTTSNTLNYPLSKYANLAAGMPEPA